MILSIFNINVIADIISAIPLVLVLSYLYLIINKYSYKNIVILCGFSIVSVLVDIIKRIPYPNSFIKYTYRPSGAQNCNLLSNNGVYPINSPGFPSGHMATMSFYFTYIYLINKKFNSIDLLILLAIGWSRYYKNCHTLLQIICGTGFGSIMAYLWSIIIKL
jgi:membrane-associated phospholipid phosphatase